MATETMTVVFTDMVGSTAQRAQLGEAAADALLLAHDEIVRRAAGRYSGRIVKDTGDGVMLVFGAAADAVHAAVAVQQAIEHRNRLGGDPIELRVGVSLGDVSSDSTGLHGLAAHEAARVCALAAAGQVLVSDVVRVVAGSRLEPRLAPHGVHELKGITDPVTVWSVVWSPISVVDERPALPPRLEPTGDVFVGRVAERSTLLDAFKQTDSSSRAHIALVSGEPGIGKTSLVGQVARTAYEQPALVLYGRCDEDLAIPYQPWVEVLRHLVVNAPVPWLDDMQPELARLVPEVRTRIPNLPDPLTSDPDAERYVLFASVVALLAAVSRDVPVVVVLDDLHWADRPTAQLLRHLGTSDIPMRLLVLGTFRDADIGPNHPLSDTLAALHREDSSSRISLHGLGDLELLDLMERTAGHELEADGLALRDVLLAETDGNPFFVAEILRHLAETGAIAQQADGRWATTAEFRATGLPVSVREVLGRRVAHLGDAAIPVLSAASVMGRDFDLRTLAQLVDEHNNDVLDLLDRAVAANLLTETAPGRFAFAHALIEHALYDELGATRRAHLHRRIAEIIEEQLAGDPGERIGELAYHWSEAIEPQDATKAAEYARQAGDHALAQLAPDEARRWYERGFELLADDRPDNRHLRCALLVGLGDAQRQVGDPAFRQTLLDAAHLADEIGDMPLLVAAAVANNRGVFSSSGTVDTERADVLRRALANAARDDVRSRAILLALLASELLWNGDFAERRAIADEAISVVRRLDDPSTLLRVLNLVYMAIWIPDTLEERRTLSGEALDLARSLGDPAGEFWALVWSSACDYERGEIQSGLPRARQIAEQLGQPAIRWFARQFQSLDATRVGDSERAESDAEESLEIGTATGQPDTLVLYGTQIAYVRWLQGRRAELVPLLKPLIEELKQIPAFPPLLAVCQLDAGEIDDARALLQAALPRLPVTPPDFTSIPGIVFWADVASRLKDAAAAKALTRVLRPYAHLMSFNGVSLQGPVADALGRLAVVIGDHESAEKYFDVADELNARLEAPFLVALSTLHRAEMQGERAATGDLDSARDNITAALEIARRYGFAGVERDAHTLRSRFNL